MPINFNYITPALPATVNGQSDPGSQRFHVSIYKRIDLMSNINIFVQDTCNLEYVVPIPKTPPFDLKYVALAIFGPYM